MPLGFLVPAFLVGLVAIGVPLLLHLRRRDRQRPMPFPSLMFLSRLPIRTQRRRRITDWPLLLLRALVILLLVAAFARPFLRSGEASETGAAGLTVLLLDRSASMAADEIGMSWHDFALAVLGALPSGRRVAVVTFDADATVLLAPTGDIAAARASLDQVPAPGGPTRFGAGLRAAAGLLAGESVPGEVVLVSDMQQSGRASGAPPALPAGTVVRSVVVEPASRDNTGVVAVDVEPVPGGTLRRAVIEARLARSGGDSARQTTVALLVDGRELATREVTVPPDAGARVRFDTVEFARSDARLEVQLTPDRFTADDRFVGVIPALAPTRVVLVVPTDVRTDEVRYLESALKIGSDPTFVVQRTTRLDPHMLDDASVIVLFDVGMPTAALEATLESWLQGGGGIVALIGDRLARRGTLVASLATDLGRAPERREPAVLGGVVLSHPALEPVREAGAAGFAQLHIRRYTRFTPAAGLTVLARFDDDLPALAAGTVGQGRAVVSAIPPDLAGGDFPLQPLFLPYMRGILGWAASATVRPLAHLAGESWTVPGSVGAPVVRGPDGSSTRIAGGRGAVTFRLGGFHELHNGRVDGVPLATLAVNLPPAESDLTPMSPDELLLGVTELAATDATGDLAPVEVARAREARQANWRWVLLAVIAALIGEAVLASRGWRGIAPPSARYPDPQGDAR
ncbi:MAG TPA: BatA domain-containing protein [Gemmatimonadales bacterium]|nr:BatA domain-containing protein [Gemmatimonadales bacterium]